MKEMIVYLLKTGLWITVFWAVYWIFFRKETFYKFNRFFLLFGLAVSFLLPFCIYRYTVNLAVIPFSVSGMEGAVSGFSGQVRLVSPWAILLILYFIGVLFLVFSNLRGIWRLNRLIVGNGFHPENGVKVVSTPDVKTTFSVLNYIFIDSSTTTSGIERKMIYEHEKAHVDQRHWIDLSIIHFVCILQWFNPFVWLYLNSIRQNHEFMADQAVLRRGNSPVFYRAALINYTLKAPVFAFTNAFAQYNKFKRIDMMKKETSSPLKKWAVLVIFPVLAVFLWVFAEPEYAFSNNNSSRMKQVIVSANVFVNDTIVDSTDTLTFDAAGQKKKNTFIYRRKKANMRGKRSAVSDSVVVVGRGKYESKDEIDSFPKASGKKKIVKPLIIIDGKESDNGIEQISTDDIESISVLKDEYSVRVYGERGRAGVVVITMKKSENGDRIISIE